MSKDNNGLQEFTDNIVNFTNNLAILISETLDFLVDLPRLILGAIWLLIKDFIEWMIE